MCTFSKVLPIQYFKTDFGQPGTQILIHWESHIEYTERNKNTHNSAADIDKSIIHIASLCFIVMLKIVRSTASKSTQTTLRFRWTYRHCRSYERYFVSNTVCECRAKCRRTTEEWSVQCSEVHGADQRAFCGGACRTDNGNVVREFLILPSLGHACGAPNFSLSFGFILMCEWQSLVKVYSG